MDTRMGLTDEEVVNSRKKYGTNEITRAKQKSFFRKLLETLGDPIIKILLVALCIKTIFLFHDFDWFETLGIVIAIFLASFISTISEYGSEQAFHRLQEESAKIKCKVKRNGTITEIPIDQVVVGDLIRLETGDMIPADGVIIDGTLSVDESSLNGETKEAYKEPVHGVVSSKNMVYRGTVVYSSIAYMEVNKVGNQTFYGKLAQELQEESPESPLKHRLRHLAKIISRIGYVGAILVSLSYLFSVIVIDNQFIPAKMLATMTDFPVISGHILYALTLSVTIIVVAVPEGLPMMITLVLSSNMKRMLKNHVLVRKLVGIETAGSINILFTDKTGTLTKGKLEVVNFLSGSMKEYATEIELSRYSRLHEMVQYACYYNNESSFSSSGEIIGGNITDRSLLKFIQMKVPSVRVLDRVAFNSKDKYALTSIDCGKKICLVKGAPEKLLPLCKTYYSESGNTIPFYKERIEKKISEATKRGIRVLVLAMQEKSGKSMRELTFIGAIFIKDEVRRDAIEGVDLVHQAGIQVVMMTGDNRDTAVAIGQETKILSKESDVILTSDELAKLEDDEVKKILPNLRIVARSLPQDKSRLVRLAEEVGLVVGMTGDGVNDAPALKRADVGFAMGSGTEVAKEASEIVILDDNFLSISKAVLFGRTIFKSIRKFIIFQLTVNMCAISLSIVGPFIGVDTPVTVIQMLWINMIMDTLAGIAFAYEPPLLEYMKEAPKKKDESILNRYMLDEIIFTGIYSSILCILFLKLPLIANFYRPDPNHKYLMTAFFGLFIFTGIFNCFNARTHRLNLLAHLYQNKVFFFIILFIIGVQMYLLYFGGNLFRTFGLTFQEFALMMFLAMTVVPIDWIRKLYLKYHLKKTGV